MTVLFLGSGLDSCTPSDGTTTENASANNIDVSFVRTGFNTGDYSLATGWTDVQELWVHCNVYFSASFNSTIFILLDGGDGVFKLERTGNNLVMSWRSGVGTYTAIGSPVPVTGGRVNEIDLYIKTGASGEAMLFVDRTEKTSGSAAITYMTDMDNISFYAGVISGIAVADEVTVGWKVIQGWPSAAGSTSAWTGAYTNIDEATLSDADYIYSSTADEVSTFAQTLQASLTGYIPRAVAVSARAKRGTTGPQNIQLALRSGSTNYFSATKALGLGYTAVQNVWNQNPDTSADWTSAQIAALQPGVKSIT